MFFEEVLEVGLAGEAKIVTNLADAVIRVLEQFFGLFQFGVGDVFSDGHAHFVFEFFL